VIDNKLTSCGVKNLSVNVTNIEVTEEVFNEYLADNNSYIYNPNADVEKGELLVIKNPKQPIYQRLKNIDMELEEATRAYTEVLNTEVEYHNGFTYYPRYAQETYATLLSAENIAQSLGLSSFPQVIKDSTKLADRAVSMSYVELSQLTIFLAQKAQEAWAIKANKEAALMAEKIELEGQLI